MTIASNAIPPAFRRFFSQKFCDWLDEGNGHIYQAFEDLGFKLINRGRLRYSARCIVDVLAFESAIHQTTGDYKINNAMACDMARLFAVRHPAYVRFWEYRRADWREFLAEVSKLPLPVVAATI